MLTQQCSGWLDLAASGEPGRPRWLDLAASRTIARPGWLNLAASSALVRNDWLDLADNHCPNDAISRKNDLLIDDMPRGVQTHMVACRLTLGVRGVFRVADAPRAHSGVSMDTRCALGVGCALTVSF